MSRDNSPPFGRGETYYGGRSIDTANLEGTELEGITKEFEDLDYSAAGAKTPRSNTRVVCRIFRNSTGVAILGKEVCHVSTTNQFRVDGKVKTAAEQRPVVVDEFLPSAGCPNGDLFWGVLKGRAIVKNSVAQAIAFAVGDELVAATGSAASTAAAATTNEHGRVNKQSFSAPTDAGSTTTFRNQMYGLIGQALTARTTAETNAEVLVDVNLAWTSAVA